MIQDKSEAFDHAIALNYWLSHNYMGQFCDKYAALSKIIGEYKLTRPPKIDFEVQWHPDDENYEIARIYNELNEDNWSETFNIFCNYMDNHWSEE